MPEILENKTVKQMEEALKNSKDEPAHTRDSLNLLLKWKNEKHLVKDEDTIKLIDKLLKEYSYY